MVCGKALALKRDSGITDERKPPRKVLLLNQTFYPDVVATSQYLTQVAVALIERGYEVRVISSERAYDDPEKLFATRERWRGIEIYRIRSSGLGKSAKWRRAVDFGTFLISCFWRLLTVPKADVVVALTSPPLISFLAACYSLIRRCRFVYWVMDLNPDEAVAAGWLRPKSLATRLLDGISRFSFRRADKIVALDRFMAARIEAKGIDPAKIETVPPWSQDELVSFDLPGREDFRKKLVVSNGYIVMYSGNHSPCHPLDTLLKAAQALAEDRQFIFYFVGGGSELPKVRKFAEQNGLSNIRCLPYQPMEQLAASLSAADLHVVVMGEPFVGTIHPCKIYNILSVGAPILYIGPEQSHITDIFNLMESARIASQAKDRNFYAARHGDVAGLVRQLESAARSARRGDPEVYRQVREKFTRKEALDRLLTIIAPGSVD